MKTTPVKGTNDYMPKEAELRDYLQGKILETYISQGFNRIYTPNLEDIENLEKSDGGDNLNLIFKVLKRGEKFTSCIENKDFENLADLGLRYDLTLPLTRFYANNRANLPSVFKCIQIDKSYRAERPQKGRDREFVQCDIDILGSDSPNCEIELIDTTAQALLNIGLKNFTIRINDRRILKAVLSSFGFKENLDSVCVTFDKMDKIGVDGVEAELTEKGFNEKAIKNLCNLIKALPKSVEEISALLSNNPKSESQQNKSQENNKSLELSNKEIKNQKEDNSNQAENETNSKEINNLKYIIDGVKKVANNKYNIEFDLSLVRGQGYYTGAVFEIESKDYSCSIGGGGRYDNLVGKFTGVDTPAVGFSIGFERIFSILKEKNLKINTKPKCAIFYNDNFVDALNYSKNIKENYNITMFEFPNKLGKFLNKLYEQGFSNYCVYGENPEIKKLESL